MKDWHAVTLGTAGTVATYVTPERIGLACGVLTFVLLARRVFFVIRGDLRRWQRNRAQGASLTEKSRENAPDRAD